MSSMKYIIPELSAQSILATAREVEGGYRFYLDATDPSREYLVEYTQQDDCPMFYQAMLALGKRAESSGVSDALRDAFVYVDFSGIFNRGGTLRILQQQKMAEHLFRPEGITLNFGGVDRRYVAFERSASMSRNNRLSFVRADLYAPIRERMMLGMEIGQCQLSKLYAYNALLFTSGDRYQNDNLLSDKRIIVIQNPKSMVPNVPVVTVEDDGTNNPMRQYTRVEKTADIAITEFDGEGLISPKLAERLAQGHSSFQIRLPYIKGVVHKVDFAALFAQLRVPYILDLWGTRHNPADIDLILTESMFKGLGWMRENGLSWEQYLARCRKYDHALYVSGMDKLEAQSTTELNYQFLNTLSITDEEFRPKDLPLGWQASPEADPRHWLTKTTETEYFRLIADPEARQQYFADEAQNAYATTAREHRSKLIEKNPLFLNEPIFAKELADRADSLLQKYSVGKLLVAGDNRYLSDDLLRLVAHIVRQTMGESYAYRVLQQEFLDGSEMYAPMPGYEKSENYTILRSPHIARNEEVLARPVVPGPLREKYLSHLGYVIMVDSRSLIPERLGGADFDGDMVKTIADPLVNKCVLENSRSLPLLKIPTAEPLISDADDWYQRFLTVKNTFSSRVGQISNAALRRGIVAYDENADAEEKQQSDFEVQTLAILTGLEIDSAKSGVKPNLVEYLGGGTARSSVFLRYKALADREDPHKWYLPGKEVRLKEFFDSVLWEEVSANIEKLPWFAHMLEKETKKITAKAAKDAELFLFAQQPDWIEKLDPAILERVKNLIADYETALQRVQFVKHLSVEMKRKGDVYRILFARGQEQEYAVDELYGVFDSMLPQRIRRARLALEENAWPYMPEQQRQEFLWSICGTARISSYLDVLCDFRHGGYRIVGDIICDLDDAYRSQSIRKNYKKQKGDSKELQAMLHGIDMAQDAKTHIIQAVKNIIRPMDVRQRCTAMDWEDVLKCAIALDKRQFALEVLPHAIWQQAVDTAPKQKKRRFWK